ncbi:MAG: DUF2480 family protein [Sphingobacteriales bacterium]|nr:DUF2480 family protein [Sphingobacteriales bacterium]
MSETLINKVAQSGLITLDLEDFFPKEEIVALDIRDFLFRGLILKELEFRASLKATDWAVYQNKIVAVHCSTDAIVPQWAWMLLATYLTNSTSRFFFGSKEEVEQKLFLLNLRNIDEKKYSGERVVIKGCGTKTLSGEAYLEITKKLQPVVKSLMFGEPCSTVPVYKKK